MRAVGKRIAEAPGEWVENLLQTFGTDCGIGRHINQMGTVSRAVTTGGNTECGTGRKASSRCTLDMIDTCKGRSFPRQSKNKCINASLLAAYMDVDALRVIPDRATQSVAPCQVPYRRTETDALNDATHTNSFGAFLRVVNDWRCEGRNNLHVEGSPTAKSRQAQSIYHETSGAHHKQHCAGPLILARLASRALRPHRPTSRPLHFCNRS